MNRFLVCFLVLSVQVLFAQQPDGDGVYDEIYVKVKPTSFVAISNSAAVNVAAELGFLPPQMISKVTATARPFFRSKVFGLNRVYAIKVENNANLLDLIAQLKANPAVEYAEPKRIRQIIGTPNDPSITSQWYLNKVGAFDAWDLPVPTGTVKVAVVDNAIQTAHPDLFANMLPGYDASDLDNDPNPPNDAFSHGTHVAGIVGAVTNNAVGIASAGNNRVKIVPIKATPNAGDPRGIYHGYESIQWAIDNNVDIINLSWGGGGYSQTEQDIINAAHAQGIVVIAAAGNANNEVPSYPAAYNHVISVASLDENDARSSFSSYGSTVDISAPGRGILSTVPTNQYATFNGTSMATPLVAAITGYLLAAYPNYTPDEVEELIKRTTDDISSQNPLFLGKLGAGRINMFKLIACKNSNLDQVTISSTSSPILCLGDDLTLKLTTAAPASAVFQWYNATQPILGANLDSIVVTQAADYRLRVTDGACEIFSNPQRVTQNEITTANPTINYLETFYCTTPNLATEKLVATTSSCNFSGPSEFSYVGPVVGFDGNERSGDYPTAYAAGLAGLITDVTVSITWQKKDVFSFNSCGDSDAGAAPYNEEVEFRLVSPEGKEIVLIAPNTYAAGSSTSGVVTTVFSSSGSPITNGSLPVSGNFAPAQSFASLIGEFPNGVWTLYANDDAFVDPLCVSNFSVIITTNAPTGSPEITWWDSPTGGTLLHTGQDFTPNTNLLGNNEVYAQATCGGACPSSRVKASYFVKNVPYIVAYPLNYLYSDPSVAASVSTQDVSFSVSDTSFVINRLGVNGETFADTFSFNSPLESPVTVCEQTCYVVVATGCPGGAVTWGGGVKGEGDIICLAGAYSVTAVCEDPMSCPPSGSNIFEFKNPDDNLVLSRRMAINANQNYNTQTISSSQVIETPAQVDYRATQSILLTPGFSVSGNSTFSAAVGGCPN